MQVDRKVLADLAVTEPISFKDIVLTSKVRFTPPFVRRALALSRKVSCGGGWLQR